MTDPVQVPLATDLPRFWRLQHDARRGDLRLTSDGERLHLRDDAGNDLLPLDLDAAERLIAMAGRTNPTITKVSE